MQIKQKAWRFDGSSWTETELEMPGELVDWDDGIRRLGYRIPQSIEFQRASYVVSVYESVREFGHFLILMTTRGSMFPVQVVGFPALLTVLNQMIPVVQMGGEAEQKYQGSTRE